MENKCDGNILKQLKYKEKRDIGTAYQSSIENGAHIDRLNRFNAKQGHGYAAEQANHILDRMKGRNAVILGDDNAKNGPDRMVDGSMVQSKYCKTAADSVNAAFRNGSYRYLDNSGHPIQLEVPFDQYEDAIKYMEKHIANGQVPGVSNPKMAEQLVRQGNIDYNTACRIAKAGNIDSLLFDAANGVVVATSAMGISAVISFAREIWNGKSLAQAADLAVYQGLKMGGITFASSVLAAQLTRTGVNNLLMGPSIQIVRLLPSSVRHSMVAALRQGPLIYGNAATNNLAKLMRSNIISAGALILVMSAGDISNFFHGKMSAKQLFKNVATLAAGMGGGVAAGAAAGSVLGPAGAIAGGLAGGMVVGEVAHKALDGMIEDDVVKMLRILDERIVPLVQEYMLSEEELDIVMDDLNRELVHDKLLAMFAATDRDAFADNLLSEIIERTICFRVNVRMINQEQMVHAIGEMLELSQTAGALDQYLNGIKIDPQSMGQKLLQREVPANAARKAWYVTKQMNTISMQQEDSLQRMMKAEQVNAVRHQENKTHLDALKSDMHEMLRSDDDDR